MVRPQVVAARQQQEEAEVKRLEETRLEHLEKAFALDRLEEKLQAEADDLQKKPKPEKSLSERRD